MQGDPHRMLYVVYAKAGYILFVTHDEERATAFADQYGGTVRPTPASHFH